MIIFDLDGTLLNTAKDLEIALNHALNTHKLPLKDEKETLKLLGNGIDMLVAGAIPEGKSNPQFPEIFATFKDYYSQHLNDYTAPYEGIIPLLETLHHKGIKMGIISNKFDDGVKELAKKFFSGLIAHAQGVTETVKKKPAPDAVFALIKEQKAEQENNIYVGDSEVDIATAQNAGLNCISVSWGFRTKETLKELGAQTIIDKPEELLKIITSAM